MASNRSILLTILAVLSFDISAEKPVGFTLVDEVCLAIEGEPPVLRSQIKSRASQKEISFVEAKVELERERLLWVYAKKQLKYNIPDIFKQADEHIKKILEGNRLTREKFAEYLMGPPHFTSFSQYRFEIATAILEHLVKSSLASQVSLTDAEIQEEMKKEKLALSKRFDVVFISVLPSAIRGKSSKKSPLTVQFEKANEIRSHVGPNVTLDEIKNRYGTDENALSIVGPIAYEPGVLKHNYDKELLFAGSDLVTKPFQDGELVTMIWKIKRKIHDDGDDNALLEKVRKKLYEAAVDRKLIAITSAMMDVSNAIVKGCQER
ncbi:MAG TPA: hypothetical protein VEL47_07920 [Myxococcota bacterium]|nr:hypothetical protein [Myxococcota bacterium]